MLSWVYTFCRKVIGLSLKSEVFWFWPDVAFWFMWSLAFGALLRHNILASFSQLTISRHISTQCWCQIRYRLKYSLYILLISIWLASSGRRHAGPCEWGWRYSNSGWHILDNLARWMYITCPSHILLSYMICQKNANKNTISYFLLLSESASYFCVLSDILMHGI